MKVLLGVTGSVAAKLTLKLITSLLNSGHEVRVVATKASFYFWNEELIEERVTILGDEDEWPGLRYDPGLPVAHIEMVKWADVFLIAPITANTLAEIANGGAKNIVTCIARAWWNYEEPYNQKPLIIAPAMNSRMWFHPVTKEQLDKLRSWYNTKFIVVRPVSRELACGDTGIGALADIKDIVSAVNEVNVKKV